MCRQHTTEVFIHPHSAHILPPEVRQERCMRSGTDQTHLAMTLLRRTAHYPPQAPQTRLSPSAVSSATVATAARYHTVHVFSRACSNIPLMDLLVDIPTNQWIWLIFPPLTSIAVKCMGGRKTLECIRGSQPTILEFLDTLMYLLCHGVAVLTHDTKLSYQ